MQKKKLKVNAAFAARKQKPVSRNPLKKTHSANNIVHDDVNTADLQKQNSDLKEIVCTNLLENKKKRKNAITACSLTLQTIGTTILLS